MPDDDHPPATPPGRMRAAGLLLGTAAAFLSFTAPVAVVMAWGAVTVVVSSAPVVSTDGINCPPPVGQPVKDPQPGGC